MRSEVKVNISNKTLTQKELDRYIEDKNTINLTNKISTKQMLRNREQRIDRKSAKTDMFRMLIVGFVFIIFCVALWSKPTHAGHIPTTPQEWERSERLSACYQVYRQHEEWVDSTFIHKDQDAVIRCATFMGLISAYESDFGKSRMCTEDNNCWGIKSNITGFFIKYNSKYEGRLHFAKLYLVGHGNNYFRGHKNRNIAEFVRNWSGDPVEVENRYITFVAKRYWGMYNSFIK